MSVEKAYLAGVLRGDGFYARGGKRTPNGYIGLRVADEDFARRFAHAIRIAYKVPCEARLDERSYWLVRKSNGYGRFNELKTFIPHRDFHTRAFLQGLFDSEGNAQCVVVRRWPNSRSRRVAFYSTNLETIELIERLLHSLDMYTRKVRTVRSTKGHLGTKPVYEIQLISRFSNYLRFYRLIGSSIGRKKRKLEEIVNTYQREQ